MYQKIVIVGNLGLDPTLRYTPQGSPVCNFPVAVNEKRKNDVTTLWFRCTVWGSQAEACNQYLAKGRAVLVEGMLKCDHATGGPKVFIRNDGTAGASFEVTANVVKFLGGREEEEAVQEEIPF